VRELIGNGLRNGVCQVTTKCKIQFVKEVDCLRQTSILATALSPGSENDLDLLRSD